MVNLFKNSTAYHNFAVLLPKTMDGILGENYCGAIAKKCNSYEIIYHFRLNLPLFFLLLLNICGECFNSSVSGTWF